MTTESGPGYRLAGKRVYVAGHRGMVGSAIVRRLAKEDCDILTAGRDRADLRRQAEVEDWMAEARPQAVFLAAARVGGILANDSHPAEFLYDNLMIEANVIEAARRVGVEKLLFLGSSCIYPKITPQPMKEEALLTGALEPTNEWYAIAKIAGLKQCEAYRRQYGCDFISAMPTNLYGENDNFDLESSHVLPALIAKAHAAKMRGEDGIEVWGTGKPRREFLYVDDAADAMVPPDAALFRRQPCQCRNGLRHHHRRPGDAGLQGGRAAGRGALPVRPARRHAGQAAGCLPPAGAGLGREDRAGGRHPPDL